MVDSTAPAAGESPTSLAVHIMRGRQFVLGVEVPSFRLGSDLRSVLEACPEWQGHYTCVCRRNPNLSYLPWPGAVAA